MLARDNNVEVILGAVRGKVADSLGVSPNDLTENVVLNIAKDLGLLRGQRGRGICGTYSTDKGLAFIGE